MDDFKRSVNVHVGVGGWHCYCCGPRQWGRKRRRNWKPMFRRWGRHHLKNQDRKLVQEETEYGE